MGTEVTTYGKYTKEQLLAMSGQVVGGNGNLMPNCYINRNEKDRDTKEELPTGVFCVDHKDLGQVFAVRYQEKKSGKGQEKVRQTIKFRPYLKRFRYEVYDSKQDATVARTIFFSDFKEELIADNGMLKAGAVKPTEPARLPESQKAKCKMYVFGTASFKGITVSGEEVEVEDHPCYIKLGGKGLFDEYDKVLKKLDRRNKLLFLYDLNINVNDEGKYPVATIDWDDLTTEHPFTDEVGETLVVFSDYVTVQNKGITKKWDMIVKHKASPEELADPTVADPDDTLANDLKDDE